MTPMDEFRNEMLTALVAKYGPQQTADILSAVDPVICKYDIHPKEMHLVPQDEATKKTIKLYLATRSVEGLKRGSLMNMAAIINKFFRFTCKPVTEIKINDVRLWFYELQTSGVSDRSRDKYRNYLSCFFKWCQAEEIIPANPMENFKQIKFEEVPREPLSDLEQEMMRDACVTKRERALFELFLASGCRIEEVARIKTAQIDWRERRIKVRGKFDKYRDIYFNAAAELALKNYIATRTDDCEALFVSAYQPYRPMTTETIRSDIEKIRERSGIGRKITPHFLRHTFATDCVRGGMDIQTASVLLGHANVGVTSRVYTHLKGDDIQSSYKKYAK